MRKTIKVKGEKLPVFEIDRLREINRITAKLQKFFRPGDPEPAKLMKRRALLEKHVCGDTMPQIVTDPFFEEDEHYNDDSFSFDDEYEITDY